MTFAVRDLKRTKLGVLFLFAPTQASPGKADDANDDQDDANNSSWFHAADATVVGDR